ncbi:MAG: DUF1963 domain-containing protein [Planctomycetes bacterium]|nr:DUF1963 domain-containing protein [Planctomycetota bacterium]
MAKKSPPVAEVASVSMDESDMLAGVIENHWSDQSLLIYADWLEDKGDPRGTFLRRVVAAFGNSAAEPLVSNEFTSAWLDMSGITLLDSLKRFNLSEHREAVSRLARTTLLIETKESSDKKMPIGSTKLGGCPDLPKGVGWPVCEKGSLAFLAQFKLADLAGAQATRRLPSEGMLSFFIFNDDGNAGPGLDFPPETDTDTIRVIHTKNLISLRRLKAPDDLGEYNQVAPCRSVKFVEALDFRRERSEIEGIYEFAKSFLHKNGEIRTTNHFFGYPLYYRMDEPEEFRKNFVHLITFQNESDLPFAWGDDADLYYYISEADLKAAKFDAVAIYTD